MTAWRRHQDLKKRNFISWANDSGFVRGGLAHFHDKAEPSLSLRENLQIPQQVKGKSCAREEHHLLGTGHQAGSDHPINHAPSALA